MDWTKVKSAIATIAPWIAGTLGSPVAGVAVKALCDVFGLSAGASPDSLVAAVAGATPEQLQALRAAELQHEEFMQKLGYDHIEQLDKIAADDRNSARVREAAVRDNTPKVLAGLAVLLFISMIALVASGFKPDDTMRDGFWLLVGAAIATFKDVYGYYFGSSSGSHGKDDTISDLAGKA
jgi:hypothetical protein